MALHLEADTEARPVVALVPLQAVLPPLEVGTVVLLVVASEAPQPRAVEAWVGL